MPILQGMCSSFKQESWLGIHDLDTDTLKMALYTANANLSQATTVYTPTDEVPTGGGYLAGGLPITGAQVLLSGTTAYLTFNNPVWFNASFVCRGALIYNASKANRTIAVIDFGADKTASGAFTIQLPAATAASALLRFA
jgi:hypothetical protein